MDDFSTDGLHRLLQDCYAGDTMTHYRTSSQKALGHVDLALKVAPAVRVSTTTTTTAHRGGHFVAA